MIAYSFKGFVQYILDLRYFQYQLICIIETIVHKARVK